VNAEASDLAVSALLFDRVLASKQNLVVVEAEDTAMVMDQFRQFARRTGQSIYTWQDEIGITSLREADVRVPGSKRMTDALRYILQSMHFGIYLFADVSTHLRPPNTGILRQIARMREGNERKVVFIAKELHLPDSLDDMTEHLTFAIVRPTRPRLRDGRWVM
jgi:hypothetical protein